MENNDNLKRLTEQSRIENILLEKTPTAMWHLLRSLGNHRPDEALKVIRAGYDINTIIKLDNPKVPEQMKDFSKKEGWDIHDEITILGISAFMNDESSVLWLLQHGAHVNTPFDNGRDALWLAMSRGNNRVMSLLKQNGASVRWSLPNEDNVNRLIFATRLSSVESVLWLKANKQDMLSADSHGRTALHYNFMQDPYAESDQRIAEILLAEGLTPNTVDDFGMPAHGYGNEEVHKYIASKGYKKLAEVTYDAEYKAQKHKEAREQIRIQKEARKTVANQRIKITRPMRGPKIMGH